MRNSYFCVTPEIKHSMSLHYNIFPINSKHINHRHISSTRTDPCDSRLPKNIQFQRHPLVFFFFQYFRKSAKSKFKDCILKELCLSFTVQPSHVTDWYSINITSTKTDVQERVSLKKTVLTISNHYRKTSLLESVPESNRNHVENNNTQPVMICSKLTINRLKFGCFRAKVWVYLLVFPHHLARSQKSLIL